MASWSSQRSAHSPRSAIAAAPTHPLRVHRLPWAPAFHPKQRTQHELGLHESRESWDNSGGGGPHADRRNAFWVSYLKRRRRMHTAAHELYIWLTNVIMLPALLLSALASVLSVMLKEEQLGPYIITGITATSTFLIGVQQHLKVRRNATAFWLLTRHNFGTGGIKSRVAPYLGAPLRPARDRGCVSFHHHGHHGARRGRMGEGAAPHCGGQSVCDAIEYSAQVREPHTCLGP